MNQVNQFFYGFAHIKGNYLAPTLEGNMYIYPFKNGSVVEVEVKDLPKDITHPYALHINEGNSCEGENFEQSGGHYNPTDVAHPMHAGDLPPLFSNDGYAYMAVYTNRFKPEDVVGKTIVIHNGADDFKTQPSGNSGAKMACGLIEKNNNYKKQ